MFTSFLMLLLLWLWVLDFFQVDRRVVYLRNGRVINTKGASKLWCYVMLVGAIYSTIHFIFTYVITL